MRSDHDALRGLRERLRAGDLLVGTFLSLGSPLAAEACALGGFDWLLVDLEHGAGSEEALVGQLLAASAHGVPVLARVETGERIRVGRALDLGATGVMLPRLDTPEEVAESMAHLRYPPAGDRGVATYNRAWGFGLRGVTGEALDDAVVGVVQIETRPAVEAVDAIARVSGVDALFVGPRDLTHALGVPGEVEARAFQDALRRVVDAAAAAGVAAGILAPGVELAQRYVDLGFTLIAVGSDASFVASTARAAVAALTTEPGATGGGD